MKLEAGPTSVEEVPAGSLGVAGAALVVRGASRRDGQVVATLAATGEVALQLTRSDVLVARWTLNADERPRHFVIPQDCSLSAFRPAATAGLGGAPVQLVTYAPRE